ncbi:MAG: hypothetical protein ACRDJW_21305 [Thermomicrobiales bacterium]
MSEDQPVHEQPPAREPEFDFRRGLKILLIVGGIVVIISMICIGFWPSTP